MISSQYSPLLADSLSKGKIDAAFLRRERGVPELAFRLSRQGALVVILPGDHRLAALKAVSPRDLVGRDIRAVSKHGSLLCVVIDNYLKRSGVNISRNMSGPHRHGNVLIASTRGVALLPAYVQNFLPSSVRVVSQGDTPTIDLVLGYKSPTSLPS